MYMYIEIRRIGKSKKYYLAHSYRKGGKVRKIKIYLGLNLSKTELKDKRGRAETEINARIRAAEKIHDPLKTILSPAELEELRTLEAKGEARISHLSEDEWARFSEAFTYDTNAIEGSMITAKEVEDILERDEWPAGKTKEDISETYGVAKAIKHIRKTKDHLSVKLMKEMHFMIFKNSKPFAGKVRPKGVEVVVADANKNVVHRGAPSAIVPRMLRDLVGWYNKNRRKYPPMVLAAVVHNQFESIHPFQDGNGRVGRLIMINILLKHGKPPLNIEMENRQDYYHALQAYQRFSDLRPTLELMIKEYRALKRVLKRKR